MAKGHVAYRVKNLDEALETFKTVLQAKLEMGRTPIPAIGLTVAFIRVGDISIELVEPMDPAAREAMEQPVVFDHLAAEVEDLDGMASNIQANGLKCDPTPPRPSAVGGRTTFISSPSLGGAVQLLGD